MPDTRLPQTQDELRKWLSQAWEDGWRQRGHMNGKPMGTLIAQRPRLLASFLMSWDFVVKRTASEPHVVGTDAPTPENDPVGRYHGRSWSGVAVARDPRGTPHDPHPKCDCIASGNLDKPKQHGADPHAKNCAVYTRKR